MTDFATAQMWMNNNVGDTAWQEQISTLDETTLRLLIAQLKIQQRTFNSRRTFVEMLLDLIPIHTCDCDKRWTTSDVPHMAECDRLRACTCPQQWIGGSDHAADCDLRATWPAPKGEPS